MRETNGNMARTVLYAHLRKSLSLHAAPESSKSSGAKRSCGFAVEKKVGAIAVRSAWTRDQCDASAKQERTASKPHSAGAETEAAQCKGSSGAETEAAQCKGSSEAGGVTNGASVQPKTDCDLPSSGATGSSAPRPGSAETSGSSVSSQGGVADTSATTPLMLTSFTQKSAGVNLMLKETSWLPLLQSRYSPRVIPQQGAPCNWQLCMKPQIL